MKARIEKLQALLQKDEAVIISGGSNRFYFTNFHSSAGYLLVSHDEAVFLIDFRYFEKAKQVVKGAKTVLCESLKKQALEILEKASVKTLFLETDEVSIDTFSAFVEAFEGIEVSKDSKISKAIAELRAIKTAAEIASIKAAQSITEKSFSYILNRIKEGITEREIALDLEFFARKNGSEGVAFDFIVVSGKNSSLPHGIPSDKPIEKGDFITMDFGARVNGYCSDMTRTVALNRLNDEQQRVYETVLTAQNKAFEKIKVGAVCRDIDAVARNFIYESGYKGCFGHGLGHSLGIDIHESPAFNTRDDTVLKSGMVITVEPGIYLEDSFGVRIEDMVLITDDGFENLTKSPKELIVL